MRKLFIITAICVPIVGLHAGDLDISNRSQQADMTRNIESMERALSLPQYPDSEALVKSNSGSGVLVDSSQNGYGLIAIETNPISVNPSNYDEVTMAYRQYSDGSYSGALGLSYSEDGGDHWISYYDLNSGLSESGARYPSTLASDNYPMVFWNEYGGGGGTYGGRAYYKYDKFMYGGAFWSEEQDVYGTPASTDSWYVIPTQNVDANGNYIVNVVFIDGLAGAGDHLHFNAKTNGAWTGTALAMSAPYTMVANASQFKVETDGTSQTAIGNMDINSQGVGYYAITAYWKDAAVSATHTLYVKKTEDYGETWSSWYTISDATLSGHFASVFPANNGTFDLPTGWTPFIGESLEVMTDESGGLHVLATVIPSQTAGYYPSYSPEVGIYHFYASSATLSGAGGPPTSFTPEITFVASMQDAYEVEIPYWYDSDVISMAYDVANEDHLYMVYYAATGGPEGASYQNSTIDILGCYSLDNGATWSKPQNLSNAIDPVNAGNPGTDETHPHLNRFAVDGQIFLMYQMPDYAQPTVSGPEAPKDYLNHVYFTKFNAATMVATDSRFSVRPDEIALKDNYPNPFNPSTQLSFSLPRAGNIELTVYDMLGQVVETLYRGKLEAGEHEFAFQANDLPSGTYLYRLTTPEFSQTKKMLLLK